MLMKQPTSRVGPKLLESILPPYCARFMYTRLLRFRSNELETAIVQGRIDLRLICGDHPASLARQGLPVFQHLANKGRFGIYPGRYPAYVHFLASGRVHIARPSSDAITS